MGENADKKMLAKWQAKAENLAGAAKANRAMVSTRESVMTAATVPIALVVAAAAGRLDGMYTAKQADGASNPHHPAAYALTVGGIVAGIAGVASGSPTLARVGADTAAAAIAGPTYGHQFNAGLSSVLKMEATKAAAKAAAIPAV
jgi:hypothetical protein